MGPRALRIRITSGDDPVWSSDRCGGGPAPGPRSLRRGLPYLADVDWDRKRCDGRTRARPGTYVIAVKAPGVRTQRQVFALR